jgi:hypothetical protein
MNEFLKDKTNTYYRNMFTANKPTIDTLSRTEVYKYFQEIGIFC